MEEEGCDGLVIVVFVVIYEGSDHGMHHHLYARHVVVVAEIFFLNSALRVHLDIEQILLQNRFARCSYFQLHF